MPKNKRLSSLGLHTVNGNDPIINKIVFDSRQVEPGCLFAALKGVNSIPKSWIKKTDSAKKILIQQ